MISKTGAVKVMDFGIARALADSGHSVTQTAAVIGTAQYLSPEQARGETVDARSDVYSLGCVLYEILTGEPPFIGDSPVAVAYQHVREDPVPPSQRHHGHLPRAGRRRAQGAGQEPGQPLPDRRRDARRPGPGAQRRGTRRAEGVHRRRAHLDAVGLHRSLRPDPADRAVAPPSARSTPSASAAAVGRPLAHRGRGAGGADRGGDDRDQHDRRQYPRRAGARRAAVRRRPMRSPTLQNAASRPGRSRSPTRPCRPIT